MISADQTNTVNPASSSADRFQWTKQWYPVAVVDYLAVDRPNSIQVLGIDMVLWRDSSKSWRCFEDVCPHRLAPLSEGRVEADGTILCAYHAWRFNGAGDCVRIPKSTPETEADRCSNPKARAIAPQYCRHFRCDRLWTPETLQKLKGLFYRYEFRHADND